MMNKIGFSLSVSLIVFCDINAIPKTGVTVGIVAANVIGFTVSYWWFLRKNPKQPTTKNRQPATMQKGTLVRTRTLQSPQGIIAHPEYLRNRRADTDGKIWGWLPGHGGDVWVVQHEHGHAVYFTEEFEQAPTTNN